MKTLFISAIFCLSASFIACSSNFEKIEIPDDKIQAVESSMRYVKQVLEKSTFDTAEIKKTWIQNKIDNELLYSGGSINIDSLSREVYENFVIEDFFPFNKHLYFSHDGSFRLNERFVGKNKRDFEKNILICKEFGSLTLQDRKRFIESVSILLENNIWSFHKFSYIDRKEGYRFDYSDQNLYINRWQARYLYIDNDASNDWFLNHGYIRIDKKNELELYKLVKGE